MIQFLQNLIKSFTDYGPALRFIFKHRLYWFFLIPIFFNVILFAGTFVAVSSFIDTLETISIDAINLENSNFWGADILQWLIGTSIGLVIHILFFFIFSYLSGYIILILLSPVLAYLSEKSEKILTGIEYPFSFRQLTKDIVRGIIIVIRNLFLEILIIIAIFFVSLIPIVGQVIGLLSPIILFLVASYFYGYSFVDYVLERKKLDVKHRVLFAKKKRGIITGNGIPFTLILLIPFLGLFLAEFFAIIATVAAVISVNTDNKNIPYD